MRRSSRRLVAGLALGLLPALAAAQNAPGAARLPVDLELVLAVDVSGSIDAEEARLQRQGYVDAFADPQVIRAIGSGPFGRIAVAYFEWAGTNWQYPVIDWTVIDGERAARAFSARLGAASIGTGPWTSISAAIDHAVPMFGRAAEGTRRVIDISGDGPNNMGRLAPQARDAAVQNRITINGLPIMNDRTDLARPPMPNLDLYYQNCVIGGPGAFLVVARGFDAFAEAIRRKLIMEIAGTAPSTGRLARFETAASRPPHHEDFLNPRPEERPQGASRRTQDHHVLSYATDGPAGRAAGLYAQAGPPADGGETGRWVPPCNEGEKRFRGVIPQTPDN